MASELACVGLEMANQSEWNDFVERVLPRAVRFGHVDGMALLRWEDPSGARLALAIKDRWAVWCRPSFAAQPSTRLAGVSRVNADVAIADVVDDTGQQLTSLGLELEQLHLLARPVKSATAAITFFGISISVHAGSEAFARSAESLLTPNADPNEPPPPHFVEQGRQWPIRVSDEFFLSYGVWGDRKHATAGARIAGVVRHAERRTVHETGQSFITVATRTAGFDATVCLSGTEFATTPEPGQVIAGDVFVVGSVPALEESNPRSSWWRRRRP